MRYKVVARQYKQPGHLIVRLEDGRVIRGSHHLPAHLKVGDTGVMVQGHHRPCFKPDAIDIEYTLV